MPFSRSLFCAIVLLSATSTFAGTLSVVSTSPGQIELAAPRETNITINFSESVNMATINNTSLRVFGINSGPMSGTFASANGGQSVVFTPARSFIPGDKVTVMLANSITASSGSPIHSAGYAWQFYVAVARATARFTESQSWNVRTGLPGGARIYGGEACDLNGNGYADIAVICEDSDDIRVYLNSADGSGMFGPRLDPPPNVGQVPSPNEPADFNNDGFVDICTGNFDSGDVTILLGNGDGTYGNRQDIVVGGQARGLVAHDFDADGDTDLACASTVASHVAVMFNDGTGTMSAPVTFDAGGDGEYGLAGGDMDGDGILDLVVGNRVSQTVSIMRGNGDGTFTFMTSQSSGGATWVVFLGDLNADGNLDVSTANSFSSNGAVIMGHGGVLDPPVTQSMGAHTVATDLADLDGDGDMDWILSSFGGGYWRVFFNDGLGNFSFDQEFTADSNPACCIAADLNNDGAMDLVLLDEIADTVRIQLNTPITPGDMNCDGSINGADIASFALAILDASSYEAQYPACAIENGDINNDAATDVGDIAMFASLLTGL